jgi:hypothetical protein
MHAHRTRTRVEGGHRVTVDLPSDFPDGEVEVIVLPAVNDADDERTESRPRRLSVDELLANRLTRPPGVEPVSLADMQSAIVDGALGRGDV